MGVVKQIANNAKTFDEMTRQQKKHVYVKMYLNKRWVEVPAMKYLEIAANSLPIGIRPDGSRVDHLVNIKKIYMKDDVEGVTHYCKIIFTEMKIVEKAARKKANKNKSLWRRILNV